MSCQRRKAAPLRNQQAERVKRALLATSALVALGLLFGRLPSLLLFFEQEGFGVDVRQHFVGFMQVEMAAFRCRPHQPLLLGRQRRMGSSRWDDATSVSEATDSVAVAGAVQVPAGEVDA